MNIEYKDFIGTYNNVYPAGYCEHLIEEFEILAVSGAGSNRLQSENAARTSKDDYQLCLNLKGHNIASFDNSCIIEMFFNGLQKCYENYAEQFAVLKHHKIRSSVFKMQRTNPGGGYHVWHGEQGSGECASRVLVYMLYLNTLEPENAGETEFLYQQRRINPTKNTMVLWPASYTHAHRGNTVYGHKSKYIVTGWFYYD